MGVSKVEANNEVLIDLTSDTVNANALAMGVTAHGADGELIVGNLFTGKPGYLEPEMFGAEGDGSTDDANAFDDMFEYSVNNGIECHIGGSYYLSRPIVGQNVRYMNASFSGSKLVYSKDILSTPKHAMIWADLDLATYRGSDTSYALQGACYDARAKAIILAFAGSDNATKLVKLGASTLAIKSTVSGTWGHCNDLTYNTYERAFYAPVSTANGQFYKFTSSTMALASTISTGVQAIFTTISFDKNDRVYYAYAGGQLYIFDENWEILNDVGIDVTVGSNLIPNDSSYTATQGSTTVNGQYLMLSSIFAGGVARSTRLSQFDYLTGNDLACVDIIDRTLNIYNECEGAFTIDNKVYITSYCSERLYIEEIDFSATNGTATDLLHYTRSANSLSDFTMSGFYTLRSAITLYSGFTLPIYTKGVLITSGSIVGSPGVDAIFIGIDASGYTYTAFRNGSTWINGKKRT